MSNIIKLSDSELSNVTGGYTLYLDLYLEKTKYIKMELYPEEYEVLKENGILKDGLLHHKDVTSAIRCLKEHGFKDNLKLVFTTVKSYKHQRHVLKKTEELNPVVPIYELK